jgi:hypothetical protein
MAKDSHLMISIIGPFLVLFALFFSQHIAQFNKPSYSFTTFRTGKKINLIEICMTYLPLIAIFSNGKDLLTEWTKFKIEVGAIWTSFAIKREISLS